MTTFKASGWYGALQRDVDAWSTRDSNPSLKYAGAVPPPGTLCVCPGNSSPNDFIVVGPRIGYAGDLWLPYARRWVPYIAAGSPCDSTLSYSAAGIDQAYRLLQRGRRIFASTGWVAGGGAEIGLNGAAWSITAEYLHVNLGKGSNPPSTCNGSGPGCAVFSGISTSTVHTAISPRTYSASASTIGSAILGAVTPTSVRPDAGRNYHLT